MEAAAASDLRQPLREKRVIETARLVLREARLSDVDDLHECFQDPVAMRYWNTLPHPDKETTAAWVNKMMESKSNGVSDFVIVFKAPDTNSTSTARMSQQKHQSAIDANQSVQRDTCIGKIGIWSGTEIGFIIAQKFWRKGIAREAICPLLDFVFDVSDLDANETGRKSKGLDEVTADVDPRNEASLGMLKGAGFEVSRMEENTFKIGDEWVHSVYLYLTRKRWIEQRSAFMPTNRVSVNG